jgi:1-acyl-sn-glycerol-3-phosphate acyltransferase
MARDDGDADAMAADFRYSTAPDHGRPLLERLGQYPRIPDLELDVARTLARITVVGLVRAQYRIQISGTIPDLPRAAFLANHSSHLDTLAFITAVPRAVRSDLVVLAAKDYFFTRLHRAIAASVLAQAVAFDRQHLSELRAWARRLADTPTGHLLVFPSGTRKSDEPHPALLAILQASHWPLVPVTISGTAEAWPVGKTLWRPFKRLRLTFGEPLPASLPPREIPHLLSAFWKEHR